MYEGGEQEGGEMSSGKIDPRLGLMERAYALLTLELLDIKDKLAKLQNLIDKAEKKEGGAPQ